MEQSSQRIPKESSGNVYPLIPKNVAPKSTRHENIHPNKAHDALRVALAEHALKIAAFADNKIADEPGERWSRDPKQLIVRGYN